MKLTDIFLYSFKSLQERKLRAALTVLGILIGPAAVIGITGLTSGYGNSITRQLLQLGTNTILVEPNSGKTITQNMINTINGIKGIKGVWPFYVIPAQISTPGGNENVEVFAINLQQGLEMAVPGLKLAEGSFPSPYDTYGAVLGWNIANPINTQYPNFKLNEVVSVKFFYAGQTFSKTFLVEGILQKFGPSYIVNVDQGIFVSLLTGSQITGNSPYSGLLVVAQSPSDVNYIMGQIEKMYGNQLTVMSSQQALNIANSITGTLNLLLASAASVSFLVAFVGVTTTMYTSTLERTKEIGILKALGFKNRDVMNIFIFESAIMGLIGGVLGVISGMGASYLLTAIIPHFLKFGNGNGNSFFFGYVTPVFSINVIIIVIIASLLIGVLAGAAPAYRAAKVDPIKVLRNE